MLALTAPRVRAAMAYYDRKLELDAKVFRRSNNALTKALTGGRHLTRPELGKVLERANIGITSGQRLGHLMLRAELDAVVCSGPRRGKQFTYALLEERVPPAARLERDEALLELTCRYFSTRGPATGQDFAWWSGLTMSDVKRGLEIAGRTLKHATIDGKDFWFAERAVPKASRSAHLLPNYDEYFIGYKVPGEPEVHGLVGLMEIQASRAGARVGPLGQPVLLFDQDRGRWDQLLIRRGLAALERAEALGGALGPYALQAAIAACHARARTPAETDWARIVALYDALAQLAPSPVVELNRAVAVAMASGPAAGLALVDALTSEPSLKGYHLLPGVRGDLLAKLGRFEEARAEFKRAASLTRNARERTMLLDRAAECRRGSAPSQPG
jgi:hypothetical protein